MDIEDRLARVRPVGPPADLRDRVLARRPTPRAGFEWVWAVSAAAALVLLSTLAARERRQALSDPTTADRTRTVLVRALTDAFGDDELLARQVATVQCGE